jgi:hypothetical protein
VLASHSQATAPAKLNNHIQIYFSDDETGSKRASLTIQGKIDLTAERAVSCSAAAGCSFEVKDGGEKRWS